MALVDFTNPDAVAWYQDHLRRLLDQGVDAFKTDFGERIPTDVVWHDGSDPERMHNYYTHLYNRAVFDLLEDERGEGEAVLFARSATAGGQQFPVHWGGDCESTFVSMAESLRGGLSLASSGFGYWSHDIGGFEGTPDAAVFKRWLRVRAAVVAQPAARVGLVPGAVGVRRGGRRRHAAVHPAQAVADAVPGGRGRPRRTRARHARDAADGAGVPRRPGRRDLDRQYMLGDDLLVAPVFSSDGDVTSTCRRALDSLLTGELITGPRWVRETHGFDSLPLLVRPGAVIPVGGGDDRPDYDWADGVELRCSRRPRASPRLSNCRTPTGEWPR